MARFNKKIHKEKKLDKIEDCYYFLYSTCRRGDACGFRHNLLSKQCKVLCEAWDRDGECREDCPLRHSRYHLKKDREIELCFFEQNGGCKKEFCEFRHMEEGKDNWKVGDIKDLAEIRRNKNMIPEEDALDPEEFEKFRKSVRFQKKSELKNKRAKKMMAMNIKQALDNMPEEQRSDFQRVLNLIEGRNASKPNSGSPATTRQQEDATEYDDELKELDDLCN